MPTLRECLEALPHRDVRGIATRLGLRRHGEHHKAEWIAGILQFWEAAQSRTQIIAALSPAAVSAAIRLAQGGEFPAPLFLAEYGTVRRPRPGQHWSPPPWEVPQTISEELYYCALLAPTPPALLEKALRLALPADLQTFFANDVLLGQDPTVADEADGAVSALLHDVAQALCFLVEKPRLALLHGRWLAPASLAELNSRLLRPDRTPLPRSHARARRLRFVFFLATAAGLCADGNLTPLGWKWLAEPALARLTLLWNAWRTAPLTLRQTYRQVTAALPEPWPGLALRHLTHLPPVFTAAQWAQAVLGRETEFAAYFTAHLPDISALDAAAASLIGTLTEDWGAVAPTAPAAAIQSFRLTAAGRWLIDPDYGHRPDLVDDDYVEPAARLDAQEDNGWQLVVSPWAPPIHLAHLAAYARQMAFPALGHVPDHATDHVTGMATGWHLYRSSTPPPARAVACGRRPVACGVVKVHSGAPHPI